MSYANGKKSGGRKPSSKNKLTLAKLQMRKEAMRRINEDLGPNAFKGDSIDFLQQIYKSPNFDMEIRMDAATRASQFERAKKSKSAINDQKINYVVHMPTPLATGSQHEQMAEWKERYKDMDGSQPADDTTGAAQADRPCSPGRRG